MLNYFFKKNNGMSLVEVMVSLSAIMIVFLGVYNLLIFSIKLTTDNKFRLASVMVANQKIEQIRNLPYAQVGTTDNAPYGSIPSNEIISNNNGIFSVNTVIDYIDDIYDGTTPADTIPYDYKDVKVQVSWNGPFGTKSITTFTKIAPKGLEMLGGGGILSILVFDANGLPIEDANIHIENNIAATTTNMDRLSNSNGTYNYIGAPESTEGYEIVVTKNGYSTSSTSPRTIENPNPTIPNATIIEGQRTEISFAIDLLSSTTIEVITATLPANWQASDDVSGSEQTNSRIAIDNAGYKYVVWQDTRQTGKPEIFGQKYDDSGVAQWGADQKIRESNNNILPDITIDSMGNLYACWNDDSNGNQDSFISRHDSSDGSEDWITKLGKSSDDEVNSRLTVYDNGFIATTTIVWQDNRNSLQGLDIYMQSTKNNGDLYPEDEILVNSNSDSSDQYSPVVAHDSTNDIYIAWTDGRNGNLDIYGAKFLQATNKLWELSLIDDASSSDQYSPAIAIDSADNIYIVWTDERNGNKDIYVQKYNSSATPLWTTELKVNSDIGTSDQHSSTIAIDSADNIYIVWTDERNGNKDIYAQKLSIAGAKLWTEDVRINIDNTTTAQYNPHIAIDKSKNPDVPYVTWESDLNGNLDVFVSSFDTYGSETPVQNIDIKVTGAKKIGENPIIYKYDNIFTTNSLGEVLLNNIEWDSYTVELVSTSTYSIIFSEPVMPLNLEPNSFELIKVYLD